MAIQPQFGYNPNTINIKSAAPLKAERQIANTKSVFEQTETVGDWLEVIAGGAEDYNRITKGMQAAEDVGQVTEAKKDYLSATVNAEYATFPAGRKLEVLDKLLNDSASKGEAYKLSMQGYLASPYAKAAVQADAARVDSGLNVAGDMFNLWQESPVWVDDGDGEGKGSTKTNREWGRTVDDFTTDYVAKFPFLSEYKPAIVMMVGAALHKDTIEGISTANTPEELGEVMLEYKENNVPLDTPRLLRSQNKETKVIVKSAASQVKVAFQSKEKEFKARAFDAQARMINSGYRTPPQLYAKEVHVTAANPVVEARANLEYTKKYEERAEADMFISKYIPGDRDTFIPNNPTLKKEWGSMVTSSLMSSFNNNDIEHFIKVGNTEIDFVGQTGETFMQLFNGAESSEEAGLLITKFNAIDAYAGGASVLNNMVGEDEYVRIKEIGYALISRPDLDVQGAKDWIDGNKAKINTIGLDPNLKRKMFNYAAKLGPQADAYISLIKNIMKGNPHMTASMLKNEYTILNTRNIEDSTGMKVDISKGVPPSQHPNVMNPEAVDKMVGGIVPEGTTNLKYINGLVISSNVDGAIIGVSNIVGIGEESNEIEIAQAVADREWEQKKLSGSQGEFNRITTEAKIAVKNGIRSVIDNIADISLGIPTRTAVSIIELIDNLLPEYWENIEPGDNPANSVFPSNWITDLEAAGLVTDALGTISAENTITPEQQAVLSAAASTAVKQAETTNVITKATSVATISKAIITHIEDREGNSRTSYTDTLGHLTGGVGHLLTKEEKLKYPMVSLDKGTYIPRKVRSAWKKQDIKEAYAAAKKQAKDFGVDDVDFIGALTSVNFQMGTDWKKKFPTLYTHLKNKKYDKAIQEVKFTKEGSGIKSKWNTQTPTRVKDFVKAIKAVSKL